MPSRRHNFIVQRNIFPRHLCVYLVIITSLLAISPCLKREGSVVLIEILHSFDALFSCHSEIVSLFSKINFLWHLVGVLRVDAR